MSPRNPEMTIHAVPNTPSLIMTPKVTYFANFSTPKYDLNIDKEILNPGTDFVTRISIYDLS